MTKFTETEYDTIKEQANAAHKPISTFVHDAALDRRLEIRYDLSPPMPELTAMAGSLGKTASNLNQIARHLNEDGNITDGIIADIRQGIQEIFSMRDELDSLKSTMKG
ncbi:MAG: plasmid mobilization relaxosome protein MobC [Lachnospiraceae bacterium]|nr:plasmid mobilization relaxosome protein MobC [Lachnospiraceae bacterium]